MIENKLKIKIKNIREGRVKMQKLTYLAAFLLLTFVGCMQESNITGPVNSVDRTQQKTIIMLPAKADMSIEDLFTTSQNISGNTGGEIHLVQSYLATNGQTVTVDCDLMVPSNNVSFQNVRNITMQVGGDQATVDFYPSMTFSQPVILNFRITGLDLSGVNPQNVGFYYVDSNGNLTATQNDGVIVDVSSGTLKVVNAKLPHFSRWAYAR